MFRDGRSCRRHCSLSCTRNPPKGRRGIGLDQKTEDRVAGTPTRGGPQEEDEAKKTEKEASEGWEDPGGRKVGFQTVKGCQDVRKEGQRVALEFLWME